MARTEVSLAGFGGQGIVLSGYIIGQAACIYDNQHAIMTQSYGPEARGGACASNVVVSDRPIAYPVVTNPQIIVVMSQEAYQKYGRRRDPNAVLIIDEELVELDKDDGGKILAAPFTRLANELGRRIVANIVMLGFFAAVSDVVSPQAMKDSILASVPKGTENLNLRAFDRGYEYGLERKQAHVGSSR